MKFPWIATKSDTNGHSENGAAIADPMVGVEGKEEGGLDSFFPHMYFENEGIRMKNGKLKVIFETLGKDMDVPTLSSFAGCLNSINFPVQFLVRQHNPRLRSFRRKLQDRIPDYLTPELREAADSLDDLLADIEQRPGIVDRRYYLVVDKEHEIELAHAINRLGLRIDKLVGDALQILYLSCFYGQSPADLPRPIDRVANLDVSGSKEIIIDGKYKRSLYLKEWPRTLARGFLSNLMMSGLSMDIAIHINPIPQNAAVKMLEWQKVKMESSVMLAAKKERSPDPAVQAALADVLEMRGKVQRGYERLFNAAVVISVFGDTPEEVDSAQRDVVSHFTAVLGKLQPLRWRQTEGSHTTMPYNTNFLYEDKVLDTSSLSMLFPFYPPDMDTRSGTLVGIDIRSNSMVTYDLYDGSFLNMNVAVLARSGGGKSFFTKLGLLRDVNMGVIGYIIDPEGEYVDMTRHAGGRVLTPGAVGMGMNPFTIDNLEDEEELLHRIGSLRRLIEVMIGDPLDGTLRGALDHALMTYYEPELDQYGTPKPKARSSFTGFYEHLKNGDAEAYQVLTGLLRQFATGSLRNLLADDGPDLLADEPTITTFDLHLLEPNMRPVAAMVCSETVWTLATRQRKPRRLIVDEVWAILQHPEGQSFMTNIAKRARKHGLGLQVITQDVQDLLSERKSNDGAVLSGRPLIQNAAVKFLLQQDTAAVQALKETFHFSDDTLKWLVGCPRGHGMLVSRDGEFPIAVEATRKETFIIDRLS